MTVRYKLGQDVPPGAFHKYVRAVRAAKIASISKADIGYILELKREDADDPDMIEVTTDWYAQHPTMATGDWLVRWNNGLLMIVPAAAFEASS